MKTKKKLSYSQRKAMSYSIRARKAADKGRCVVCRSPHRDSIEQCMKYKTMNYKAIVSNFGTKEHPLNTWALTEHRKHALVPKMTQELIQKGSHNYPTDKVLSVVPSLAKADLNLDFLHQECMRILFEAREEGDTKTQLEAIEKDMRCTNLFFKGLETTAFLKNDGDWKNVLPDLLKAIEDMPAAKAAIAKVLNGAATNKKGE
jgi:hypothetical protein